MGGFSSPMSAALPRSVNGYPIFMETAMVHREDWEKIHKLLGKRVAAIKAAEEDEKE